MYRTSVFGNVRVQVTLEASLNQVDEHVLHDTCVQCGWKCCITFGVLTETENKGMHRNKIFPVVHFFCEFCDYKDITMRLYCLGW